MAQDRYDELFEENGRLDFSQIESGDKIKLCVRRFIHDPNVFADIEDEIQEFTFTVDRKTHPSGSNVNTILWMKDSWDLNDKGALSRTNGIEWYVEEFEIL